MENIIEMLNTDICKIITICGIIILFLLYIINIIKLSKLRRSYQTFMNKIGNGNNIQETIENYMKKIDEVENENKELKAYCTELDNNVSKCIQKIGLVRYNAFRDTGSDLSFTLALLNEENTGVVLNGIYSRDASNIYSKPVNKGISSYKLSEEEQQAIEKAIRNER